MRKFSDILLESFDNGIQFGEEIQIEDKEAVILPVIVDGKEIPTEDIQFTITPEYLDNKICYRPDILIKPELRHQGLGYRIYNAFIHEFGNIVSPDRYRTNEVEIPKIYDKLSREPDIIVKRMSGGYYAYLKNQE